MLTGGLEVSFSIFRGVVDSSFAVFGFKNVKINVFGENNFRCIFINRSAGVYKLVQVT